MMEKGKLYGYNEKGNEFYGIFDHAEPGYIGGNNVFSISVYAHTFLDKVRVTVDKNQVHNYYGIHLTDDNEHWKRFYDLLDMAGYEEIKGKWVLKINLENIKNHFESGKLLTHEEIQFLIDHCEE